MSDEDRDLQAVRQVRRIARAMVDGEPVEVAPHRGKLGAVLGRLSVALDDLREAADHADPHNRPMTELEAGPTETARRLGYAQGLRAAARHLTEEVLASGSASVSQGGEG